MGIIILDRLFNSEPVTIMPSLTIMARQDSTSIKLKLPGAKKDRRHTVSVNMIYLQNTMVKNLLVTL